MAGVSAGGAYWNGQYYASQAAATAAAMAGKKIANNPTQPASGTAAAEYPSSLVTTTEHNPSGTMSSTSTPNLGPQQHSFAMEEQQGQQNANSALASQQAMATADLSRQQQSAEQALLAQRANLSDNSFQQRFSLLNAQGRGALEPVTFSGGAGGGISPNETAARAAAFARAKESAGSNALAGLRSVQDLGESRGTTGSSYEAELMGGVLGGASGGVNDYIREQLLQDLSRSANVGDMEYQGRITQRGQDLSARNALLGLMNAGPLY